MRDVVTQITEAVDGLGEAEVSAILSDLGTSGACQSGEPQPAAPRTPLPGPRDCSRIRSEIAWF